MDAASRLQARGPLLWLAQCLREAQRAAQSALDDPDGSPAGLPDLLDFAVPPHVRDVGPDGAEQLVTAIARARYEAEHLASAARRSARRTLVRLAADLSEAAELLERMCNDVCGEDLRAADLSHLYLGGIRWDAATRWPTGWADQLHAASDRIDGIFQIRDG